MGMILDLKNGEIHAEARSESFVIFTDFGEDRIELLWVQMAAVKEAVRALERYGKKHGKPLAREERKRRTR